MAVGTLSFLRFDKLSEDKLPLHIALIEQALCLRAQMWRYKKIKCSNNHFCLDLEDIKCDSLTCGKG